MNNVAHFLTNQNLTDQIIEEYFVVNPDRSKSEHLPAEMLATDEDEYTGSPVPRLSRAALEAYILIFMGIFACVCFLFCYLGFYCSQSHFENLPASNYDCEMTKDVVTNFTYHDHRLIQTRNSSISFLLNDVEGSITNLKDMDDDEKYFSQVKEMAKKCSRRHSKITLQKSLSSSPKSKISSDGHDEDLEQQEVAEVSASSPDVEGVKSSNQEDILEEESSKLLPHPDVEEVGQKISCFHETAL